MRQVQQFEETSTSPVRSLENVLSPIDVERFLTKFRGQEAFYISGDSSRFSELFTWTDINDHLANYRLEVNRVHVVGAKSGVHDLTEPVPRLSPRGTPRRFVPDRLREALSDGATLVIDSVEEAVPSVRDLVESLERDLGSFCQANLYANLTGNREGFGVHWDDHDVLILQVEGVKFWEVHPPTEPVPIAGVSNPARPEPDQMVWSGKLTAGDVLYLPRGWWHRVVPVGEPTAHLTIGSRSPTGKELLHALTQHVLGDEILRQDVPPHGAKSADYFAAARAAIEAAVREPGVLEGLAATLYTRVPVRPVFDLPANHRRGPGDD